MSYVTASKRVLAATLLIGLVAPSAALLSPARVHAQFVVVDPTNLVQNTLTAVTSTRSLAEMISKHLGILLAQAAIRSVTVSTVNWINSGFQGKPAFATDLNRNLRQLGDGVAQGFVTGFIDAAAPHSPFLDQIITNTLTAYYLYSDRDAIQRRLESTLGRATNNQAAFLNGDFDQGGWEAWRLAFLNPANNPYGAQMIAAEELEKSIAEAANQRITELGWGRGFLSLKSCSTGSETNLSDADTCFGTTKTPGTVIENKLQTVVNIPLEQLGVANSIDQVLGALAMQLVSQVLGDGGLSGASSPASGGGRTPVTQTGTGGSVSATIATYSDSIAQTRSQVQQFQSSWQTLRSVAEAAQQSCSNNPSALTGTVQPALNEASAALAKATSALATLATLSAQATAAASASATAQPALIGQLTSAYQAFGANAGNPSASEISYAAIQSRDSGDTTPATLYTQLTRLAQDCNAGN